MNGIEIQTDDMKVNVKDGSIIGVRHLQFFLLFLLLVVGYGMRINMSMGIVAMTEESPPNSNIPTYPNWTETNVILSSFDWGYSVVQIFSGVLSEKYGPKWFLVSTMSICSLFHILIPFSADKFGAYGVIVCRVIEGVCQSCLYPSIHCLLSKWMSVSERSTISTLVYGGAIFGTVLSMLSTGFISDSQMGWVWSFYIYGVIGLVWVVIWAFFGSNTPNDYRQVAKKELEQSLEEEEEVQTVKTPWLAILTSLPFWAIMLAQIGTDWGFTTLIYELPTYMKNIMELDLQQNSFTSALPFLILWLLSFFVGPLADYLINRRILKTVKVRKLFQLTGSFVPAFCLLLLGFIKSKEYKTLAVILLVIGTGAIVMTACGYVVNHIDLAPNLAGTLYAITNCVSTVCGILAPLLLDFIGKDTTDPDLWTTVFWFAAGLYTFTGIFYGLFASSDTQKWNTVCTKKKINT